MTTTEESQSTQSSTMVDAAAENVNVRLRRSSSSIPIIHQAHPNRPSSMLTITTSTPRVPVLSTPRLLTSTSTPRLLTSTTTPRLLTSTSPSMQQHTQSPWTISSALFHNHHNHPHHTNHHQHPWKHNHNSNHKEWPVFMQHIRHWLLKPQRWSLIGLLLLILLLALTCSLSMHYMFWIWNAHYNNKNDRTTNPLVFPDRTLPVHGLNLRSSSFSSILSNHSSSESRRGAKVGLDSGVSSPVWFVAPRVVFMGDALQPQQQTQPQLPWEKREESTTGTDIVPGEELDRIQNPNTPSAISLKDLNATLPVLVSSDHHSPNASSASSLSAEQAQQLQSQHVPPIAKPEPKCRPMSEWQIKSFPNCNVFHETDFTDSIQRNELSELGRGWFRTTWMLNRTTTTVHGQDGIRNSNSNVNDGSNSSPSEDVPLVLKTLRMEREFLEEYFELHRRDATAMERLTWSEFVVNVYGYCGQSALNEMADFPFNDIRDLEKFNRQLRNRSGPMIDKIKLQLAASVAQGVADIHSIDGFERATMVHYDLNPRNIALFARGRPKINDFNIAEFLMFDPSTNETCGFPNRMRQPWWRAPEEVDLNRTVYLDEKVDVYSLCNILFAIFTTHAPRGKMKDYRMEEIRSLVLAGIPPAISYPYNVTKTSITDVFTHIFSRCFEKDPKKRASAQEITNILINATYDWIEENKEPEKKKTHKSDNKEPEKKKTHKSDSNKEPEKKKTHKSSHKHHKDRHRKRGSVVESSKSEEDKHDAIAAIGKDTKPVVDDDSEDTAIDAKARTRRR